MSNKSGITIRIGVNTLREMGRATQGVKIIRLKDDDSIASVAKVSRFKGEENEILEENLETSENSNKNNLTEEEQNTGTEFDLATGTKNHITVNTASDWTINNNTVSNNLE